MLAPLVNGSFATQATLTSVDYDRNRAQQPSGGDASAIRISYDAADNSYVVENGEQTLRFGPQDAVLPGFDWSFVQRGGDDENRLDLSRGFRSLSDSDPRYVRNGLAYRSTLNFIDDIRSYDAVDFVFGLPSEASAVPLSGRAAHRLDLLGSVSATSAGGSPFDTLTLLSGTGALLIDFGTGQVDLFGRTLATNTQGQSNFASAFGEISGTASIATGTNGFAGTFAAFQPGVPSVSGAWQGLFYGPQADEVGGTLYAITDDLHYSFSFSGREFAPTLPGDTLADLASFTRFRGVRKFATDSQVTEDFVTFDPGTQTWSIATSLFVIDFESRNRVPAADQPDFLAYRATQPVAGGEAEYDIALFDGSTQGVELTYSSFMRVEGKLLDSGGNLGGIIGGDTSFDYIGFGNYTPIDQLPVSGSARYAGALVGRLRQREELLAELTGKSELTIDFLTRSLTARLAPAGADSIGNTIAFGTYDFNGSLDRFEGVLRGVTNNGSVGQLLGRLFGDAAQEYVATFAIEDRALGLLDGVVFGTVAP